MNERNQGRSSMALDSENPWRGRVRDPSSGLYVGSGGTGSVDIPGWRSPRARRFGGGAQEMTRITKSLAIVLLSIYLALMVCGVFASVAFGWSVTP